MSRMIRSKREYRCSKCTHSQIKWEGTCRNCGAIDSLQEIILLPTKPKPIGTDAARKLRRRAKDSERNIAKRMVDVDGPDPAFAKIASSTGRIGHITGIRIDAVSRSYVTENKNRKLPSWAIAAWILINQRALDFGKHALLHIEPPNMPKEFILNNAMQKLDTMAVITQSRHEELIKIEKTLSFLFEVLENKPEVQAELQAAIRMLQSG